MDPRHVELLQDADPAELGRRVRTARLAQGLTQTELGGEEISVAYVSRIESGQRRPTVKVLEALARRLEVPVEQLLGCLPAADMEEIRLTLDYAELALESGEPADAEARAREAIARLQGVTDGPHDRARFLHARALEMLGRVDDAIMALEDLLRSGAGSLLRVQAAIALSRAYRESGDLNRAIEAGERTLDQLADWGLDSCDEAVQLTVTVAAAYFERGDAGHAVRICRAAIAKADRLGSTTARASAYWNASAMQARRGEISEAVPLAERALALLSEGQDARNLSRLRTELGRLQLTLDPPAVDEARENLERAAEEMSWSSATPVDRAWVELGLARAAYLSGELTQAREHTAAVRSVAAGQAPLAEAEAVSLEGQTYAAEGDTGTAVQCYHHAVRLLTAVGADHGAAQLWFDLADQLDALGMTAAARDAYRRAAASTGLQSRRTAIPATVQAAIPDAVPGAIPGAIPARAYAVNA